MPVVGCHSDLTRDGVMISAMAFAFDMAFPLDMVSALDIAFALDELRTGVA